MTITKFQAKFPTEKAVIDYFFAARYHVRLTCPHCGAIQGLQGQEAAAGLPLLELRQLVFALFWDDFQEISTRT